MSLRRLLNVVYVHLIAGADEEGRQEFDRELNASLIGWAATERNFLRLLEGD